MELRLGRGQYLVLGRTRTPQPGLRSRCPPICSLPELPSEVLRVKTLHFSKRFSPTRIQGGATSQRRLGGYALNTTCSCETSSGLFPSPRVWKMRVAVPSPPRVGKKGGLGSIWWPQAACGPVIVFLWTPPPSSPLPQGPPTSPAQTKGGQSCVCGSLMAGSDHPV